MSLDNCSVKVIKEVETNHVSPFLTFLSETWNCFLAPKIGKRPFGIRLRKLKYFYEADFPNAKWGCFI